MKFSHIYKLPSVFTLSVVAFGILTLVAGCHSLKRTPQEVDILVINGKVYLGDMSGEQNLDIGICEDRICLLAQTSEHNVIAKQIIDARGQVVSPGFIDPHTHSLEELLSKDKNHNLNYLTQGVTTVINGNDGDGSYKIKETASKLETNGIGTNVGLLAGHNKIRTAVMGRENRYASQYEIQQMRQLVASAMKEGALGLSTGLYYVPGSYAATEEVVELAKAAAEYGGIYDTHLRDESTFNIGFLSALDEAMDITRQAGIHLHLAHIKALGVDSWGLSHQAVDKIQQAINSGFSISADQYPWLASGTKLHSAIMPKWVMADSKSAFYNRLNDPKLQSRLKTEIAENIRRRGGPESLLVTAFKDESMVGKTLLDLSKEYAMSPAKTAMQLVQLGDIRVASFNMSENDVEHFMQQDWVVTSSDGTNGHPRKYASFPKKFQTYVAEKNVLNLDEFISRSSGKTAKLLGLKDRGEIKQGYMADVIIWTPEMFEAKANFSKWDTYSTGISTVLVNGQVVIQNGQFQQILAGRFIAK